MGGHSPDTFKGRGGYLRNRCRRYRTSRTKLSCSYTINAIFRRCLGTLSYAELRLDIRKQVISTNYLMGDSRFEGGFGKANEGKLEFPC